MSDSLSLSLLPDIWRARAAELEPYAPPAAAAFREAAANLEKSMTDTLFEVLDLHDASIESGYSPGHLRRLLREGAVANAGTKGAPRIIRRNLPRKPGTAPVPEVIVAATQRTLARVDIARAIAAGHESGGQADGA